MNPEVLTARVTDHRGGARTALLAASGCCLLALTTALAPWPGESARAQSASCAAQPFLLSPRGTTVNKRFTLIFRVKNLDEAARLADTSAEDGGIPARLRPRDIFLINTRHGFMTPDYQAQVVATIRQSFPCNRIVSLNGLSFDPEAPSYLLALHDNPSVSALLLDWESGDWNHGRLTAPAIPPWTDSFQPTLRRMRKRVGRVVGAIRYVGGGRRVGIVPAFNRRWRYARIAQMIDAKNRRLGYRRGLQSLQIQGVCRGGGHRRYKATSKRVLRGYRRARLDVRGLGLQVSFTDAPDPSSGLAVNSVGPARAALCTRAGLKRGGGAFLYWARPEAVASLLRLPRICVLRRPPSGIC